MFKEIESAIHWLQTQKNPQSRNGLERLRHALDYLGNPHERLSVIHITGTNGKGSVTAYLNHLLTRYGQKVGAFTSPHIMQFNERIALNNQPISDEDLLDLANQMVQLNEYLATTEYGIIVGFELYTVMACVYFAQQQCDVCLIEVGIGGLYDCTNVLTGEVAVITTIGIDHADKLGHSIEEIAFQKAGIIKKNAQVIVGYVDAVSKQVIQQKVDAELATVTYADALDVQLLQSSVEGTKFTFNHRVFEVTMIGKHQVDNAIVALQAFMSWMNLHRKEIHWQSVQHALKQTQWLARMEKLGEQPLIYIDGAHNEAGLTALEAMLPLFADKELTIIYAGLSTKNQAKHLAKLETFAVQQLVVSQFEHLYALSADDLYQQAPTPTRWQVVPDWQSFIQDYQANNRTNASSLLLVTGSLYFVSQVRTYLLG